MVSAVGSASEPMGGLSATATLTVTFELSRTSSAAPTPVGRSVTTSLSPSAMAQAVALPLTNSTMGMVSGSGALSRVAAAEPLGKALVICWASATTALSVVGSSDVVGGVMCNRA